MNDDLELLTTKSQSKTLGPYYTLDAWREVASLWVMGFHLSAVILSFYRALSDSLFYRLMQQGYLGVQLFFVISGYCIINAAATNLHRDRKPLKYLKARIRRIFPTYWAALILALIVTSAALVLDPHGRTAQNLQQQHLLRAPKAPQEMLLLLGYNFTLTAVLFHQIPFILPAWTLCYEVAFYLIVGATLWWVVQYRKDEETLLRILHGLTLLCLLYLLAFSHYVYPLNLWPQFGLGILVYDWLRFPSHRPRFMLFLTGLGILGLSLFKPHLSLGFVFARTLFPQFLISWLFALLLISLHRFDSHTTTMMFLRPLFKIGVFSYSLYITHTIFQGISHHFMQKLHLSAEFHPLLFLTGSAIEIGFAYLFYLVFEHPFISTRRQKMVKAMQHVSAEPATTT
ncbi:MAG TPA: acyltransferase [Chthonomonas sp.]|uniref:acyltransferase family protein n=1 Tax=Chthonomonas sp. TaxID=2282153 RepID=UPI002B4B1446|nr:acyltransferase [Chthonomonas sp.]HLI49424.1 acyltransferase [Chthonomonas sp.]